jgi:hypothetical protein
MALAPGSAAAQQITDFLGSDIPFDIQRGEAVSVQDRQHPELEPLGIRTGSMVLFPALTTGIGYTTNVYGLPAAAVGDGFTTVQPQLALISQWSRNYLELTGSGDIKRYFSQTKRNETGYSVQADGRIDLGTNDNIIGVVHHERAYQEQYSGAFSQNAADPIGFDQTDATLRGTFEFNRVRLIASQRIIDLVFSNAFTLADQPIDEQYRNRTEYHSAIRAEYGFNPDIAIFGEASYVRSDYHVAAAGQPLRNNNATRFLLGGNFDIGKLFRGTIGVGYENHQYDLSFYSPIKGIAVDAQLQWLPTELTTISLNATRKVEDAINFHSPGFFASIAQLRIDHELLRYVQLFAEGTYERDNFVALPRRDTQYEVHTGAIYSLGRHFKLTPSVWYINRNSVGGDFGPIFKEVRGTLELFTQW